jgi:hypothetical protein
MRHVANRMNQSVQRGELDAIALLELLVSAGRQQRSGVLTLQSSTDRIDLTLVEGTICSVFTNDPSLRIGQVLIQLELITEEQIEQALALQSIATDPERIGQVLVDVGYITDDDVGYAMATQVASALRVILNDDGPVYAFLPQSYNDMVTPERTIENDPIVLTSLLVAERWVAEQFGGEHLTVEHHAGHDAVDIEPFHHQVIDRLSQLRNTITSLAERRDPASRRVLRGVNALLDHVRLHSIRASGRRTGHGAASRSSHVSYRVQFIDEEIDIWTLTDLTRSGRQILLNLLNGEDRLDVLLRDLKEVSTQPDRAIRELASAGLIRIEPDSTRSDASSGSDDDRPERTVTLRIIP